MIHIDNDDFYQAIKTAYSKIEGAPSSDDEDIYHEDTAVFVFSADYIDPQLIKLEKDSLAIEFERDKYFPNNTSLKVEPENEYWTNKLMGGGFMDRVVDHIQTYPQSRSGLYNFWNNEDFETNNPKADCVTQLYFRIRQGELEMHAHVRANDVHRCMFLDLAYLMFAHSYIAKKTGYPKGAFIHFVDSLHTYNKVADEFKRQIVYMKNADVWNS